jgi:hypothetical protein
MSTAKPSQILGNPAKAWSNPSKTIAAASMDAMKDGLLCGWRPFFRF